MVVRRSNGRYSSPLRQQAFLLSLLAAASLNPLVSLHYLTRTNNSPSNEVDMISFLLRRRGHNATHVAPIHTGTSPKNPVTNLFETPGLAAKQFEWKCSDECSCLPPPVRNDTTTTTYMHQSYKTANQTLWPQGWTLFRNSWLELHKEADWTFVFWLDQHNDLLAQCTGFGPLFQGRGPLQKASVIR
jgi:hypothetical protein